jgi:tRNA U34 5-methylaminomethyl-2-thiouridine-forming methyltransferase MnmC
MHFKTKFSEYELIQTEDDSWAIYSDYYKENSHSLVGARSETLYNFINGCELSEKMSQKSSLVVLEVGFGIGNGIATTLNFWKKQEIKPDSFTFISQEIDPELVTFSFEEGPYRDDLKELHQNEEWSWTLIENGKRFELKVLPGDARQSVKDVAQDSVHAIFQDAYSPGKNPDLWTLEWFRDLNNVANEECIMTTYSASARIRRSMAQAGWYVCDQKGFGSKRSMSIAYKSENENSINEKILKANLEALQDKDLK